MYIDAYLVGKAKSVVGLEKPRRGLRHVVGVQAVYCLS